MKNKRLNEIAKESQKKLINQDIKQRLFDEQDKLSSKKKTSVFSNPKFKIGAFSALSCALVIAIVLSCVLLIPPKDGVGDNGNSNGSVYADENAEMLSINKESINITLVNYSLNIDCIGNASVAQDKLSGDKLYYRFDAENEELFARGQIVVVVNERFEYALKSTSETGSIFDTTLHYTDKVTYDSENEVYSHELYGYFELEGKTVVIENYTAWTDSSDSGVVELLENVFVAK